MFLQVVLLIHLFQNDPVRAAEFQLRALADYTREHNRQAQATQLLRKQQFEAKFNRLVDAVAKFADRYNAGKGHTWPVREAANLRKAMAELQSLAPVVRDPDSPDSHRRP
jgi:hypothetical protein